MKYLIKKIYLILFLINILLLSTVSFGKDIFPKHSKEDISNYLSGIISVDQNDTTAGFGYLNKVQSIKNIHSNYNIQFIRTLILLEKFEEAFAFSKSVWYENKLFFEADLLLGIESFIKEDYSSAKKYFERLNEISQHNLLLDDFIGNVLISWVKASENKKKDSFKFFAKIPERYINLKKIQDSFLHCYFNTPETETTFKKLIEVEESNFVRYNFFLANYLITKNKNIEAETQIKNSRGKRNSNLLTKQTENFILNKNHKKITNFFNCENPKDSVAEIFYIIANLYSSQRNYQLSNFYLKLSLFLNKKFTPNKTLLAENFFNQKKYKLSKETYDSLRSIGSVYSWYASINSAIILSDTEGKKKATQILEKEFNLLSSPNFEHYYELANFFKDNEYFEESVKYYSLALENIKKDHFLVPKILDRRGTSYERLKDWVRAEKDLIDSLKILPEQPYVLNYLAYTWIEKRINIDKALVMLEHANKLRENDGYIIDSLGWGHYVNKNYVDAEKFLQRAVELKPLDPIINDHYADTLWMLNKNIQARYFWKYVLSLDGVKKKQKKKINEKLIFGIIKKI